ncbi:ATP synthase F1 subcomplex epsilon subunit [Neorhizobium sp. R1-B]|jgi:F-type H+-transporting ATPase subunit epsilon|uniref:F0F1 ATP synthase subunit epsilon n=1 Tax=unclassified Neorhizobium TaxID=2629175 RepID=UPI00104E5C95|nr:MULTISPECIES: F0F1 ATP synthase subunit epsilon [unclassified Neorhizobium]TCV70901.1 ATP synthase F1 subcomplex epsilon subunit [Neorhizobium sp. S3-V5DH]TDX83456.1 ATP synthase F1 subcomplex epsilon subunit [Neorhizobium sp. R1-B]
MADAFNFELVSPERLLVSEKATEVVIPATLGEMTVLANHAPTMTTIKPGIVSVKLASGQINKYVVFGGFADILPTSCTLLAESAVPASEVTRDTLQKRIEATQAEINKAQSDEHKTKLEQFLAELTHLNGIVVPA